MQDTEKKIIALVSSAAGGAPAGGVVQCEAGEGVCAYAGELSVGRFRRKVRDVDDLVAALPDGRSRLSRLLLDLREQSRAAPQGPWYRCDLQFDGGRAGFRYFWEGQPYVSVRDLEPTLDGGVPSFVLHQRFDAALVAELGDADLDSCLYFYVPARVRAGKSTTEPLMEMFALTEWCSDVNNGGMDQYFARDIEPMSGLPRLELYARTLAGLERIGDTHAGAIYRESLGLYAHFHTRVESARLRLGIDALAPQEDSDIMRRYDAALPELERLRRVYLRDQARVLEQRD